MQEISTILKEKKLKLTPQRIAIFNMLYRTKTHPTADMIYKSLSKAYPSMSLATVYKNLISLKEVGLIKEMNAGEDSFRYDANCENHPHFLCRNCGGVFDLPEIKELKNAREKLCEETSFLIEEEEIFYYGKCKDCSEK